MIIFNDTSAESKQSRLIDDYIFEWTEDCTTVFLKWTDFREQLYKQDAYPSQSYKDLVLPSCNEKMKWID